MSLPSLPGTLRQAATLLFGAIPATALLLLAYSLLGPVLRGGGDIAPLLGVLGLLVFATLGTAGLWRVTLRRNYTNWLNACLLLAGVLAISPAVLFAFEKDPMWFIPHGLGRDSLEAMLILGPALTATAYLVAMGARRLSGR